jgi:hypothetical protein
MNEVLLGRKEEIFHQNRLVYVLSANTRMQECVSEAEIFKLTAYKGVLEA